MEMTSARLLAATETGAWVVDLATDSARATLQEPVRCVAAGPGGVALAGGAGGLWLSRDEGESWESVELTEPDVFSVAVSPADGALYAGTEPSRLFVSAAPDEPWEELEALQRIPSRPRWRFPPRPWTHHVRWIAPSPHDPDRILVGIELGGVMLSTDRGQSFSDHRPGAVLDAHELAWHPLAEGRAYEVGGTGAAWSEDAGESWRDAADGLEVSYCWALAASPREPDLWWIAAAPGPFQAHGRQPADARLYRRTNGTWQRLAGPLKVMPYALVATDDALVMGLRDGRLRTSDDAGETWEEVSQRLGSLSALAVTPVGG
jgi:photosystem II stability/assembly factor-like uncharacterized protein